MTRRIRYQVACSLDGFIADPEGGYDWIVDEPEFDFGALFAQFDTLLMGRKTYEVLQKMKYPTPGMRVIVFSRTLRPEDYPDITIVSEDVAGTVAKLRAEPGKDIWIFGGGELFRTLLELGCVDTVEPAIIPILLGEGIPMFPSTKTRHSLRLTRQRVYEKSGIVLLEYALD